MFFASFIFCIFVYLILTAFVIYRAFASPFSTPSFIRMSGCLVLRRQCYCSHCSWQKLGSVIQIKPSESILDYEHVWLTVTCQFHQQIIRQTVGKWVQITTYRNIENEELGSFEARVKMKLSCTGTYFLFATIFQYIMATSFVMVTLQIILRTGNQTMICSLLEWDKTWTLCKITLKIYVEGAEHNRSTFTACQ